MRAPDHDTLKALAGWRPDDGVISVYLGIDHADRGEAWRIALKDELAFLREQGDLLDHEAKTAVRATVDRIAERFPPDSPPPDGRLHIGFCEVSAKGGREEWSSVQLDGLATRAAHLDHPLLAPLAAVLDDGAPVGAAVVSAERVRLLEWSLGELTEVDDWEAAFFELDWRERKAQKPADPARAQGTSSSGADQHDQRLEANRARFLNEVGGRIDKQARGRDWRALLVFGDSAHFRELSEGIRDQGDVRHASDVNVISEDLGSLQERIGAAVEEVNRQRESDLVERAKDAALSSNGRGTLGRADAEAALREARVAHLILVSEIAESGPPDPGRPPIDEHEGLVEQAISTGAEVTPVEGLAAEALSQHDGVAALLRY